MLSQDGLWEESLDRFLRKKWRRVISETCKNKLARTKLKHLPPDYIQKAADPFFGIVRLI